MKKIIALISSLAILALAVGPSLGAQPRPATTQDSTVHRVFVPLVARNSTQPEAITIVRVSKANYLQAAQLIRPLLSLDYGSFVWLELDAANLAMLRNSGVDFEVQQQANLLFLNRFQFDPLEGEPQIPPEQQTTYAPGEEGFYLVQFFGPTQDEWLAGLRAAGAGVIQFQASHAYIVRMTPEEAAFVNKQDFVRWVGIYHAAYRIAPSLLAPPGPAAPTQQIIRNVDVTIYNTGQVSETITAIQRLGGQFIQQFPATPDNSLVTAIFALPSEAVVDVAQLNAVLWMNFSSPEPQFDDEVSDQIAAGNQTAGVPFTGYNAWLTTTGFNGTGIRVADVDTGMDTNNNATAHADIRGRIAAFVPYPGAPATDTNGHGTHTGGIIAGNATLGTVDVNNFLYGLGVAPNAQLVVQNALSGTPWPPAGGWQQLSRDSVINGAVASNNSWNSGPPAGYSGPARTQDILVRDADFTTGAVAEPLIMVFSAGNSGPGVSTITEPKEAKNLITVGASENFRNDAWVAAARAALIGLGASPNACGNPTNINNMAGFSSRGPASDGRILPNITAPGSYIASLRSATGSFGIVATGGCDDIIDANYVWMSGTSQAAPHVTGAVALITQWWRAFNAGVNPSPAMAKALLINGAVDMGAADIPNNNEGWGRINLNNVINPAVPVIYRDQTTIFGATGQTMSLPVRPANPAQPLKVTLVWSDAPGAGSGGTTAAWVNDLDLIVTQGATTFRGNVFASGWSTPGGAADTRNNVENVYIQSPSGAYNITISAANIAGDGVLYNADSTDQDFALVCYNCTLVPDLTLTKTDSPDPVVAGTNLIYTLAVNNQGPVAAAGVTLTDTLPAGVTFVSATPSQGTCSVSGSIVTCNIGNLANGANATVTIVVTVNSSTPCGTTLTNTADVSGTEPDPNPGNNTASAVTAVICKADLAITKSATTNPVVAGTDETYNLTVTNNGPSDAQNVTLLDGTPTNTTFVSFMRNTGAAFTCTTPPSGGTGNVSCTLATLPAGATATFSFVVHVSPSAPDGSTLSNTATVSSSTTDPNPGNNSATITTAVITRADLSVTKSQTSNLVIADTNQTYNFTIVNGGPSDAQNVTMSDPTPANTTFVSLVQNSSPAFTCTTPPLGGTGNVSCTLATLAAGASASFTMVVRISPVDTNSIANTASVASSTTDPNPANNAATVTALDSINAYKQSVLTDLIALRSTVTNKQIGQKLDKAIQDLSNSLDPSLWVDGNLLDAKRGDKVFTDEKDAVVFMGDLIKRNDGGLAGTLQGLVSRLLAADHALADIAINQAVSAGGASNLIAQAQSQLAQGDGSASNSIVAIEHYRNAWQHAQLALSK